MPGNEPTSEQLHTVVYLIAGMGDSEPASHDPNNPTPTDKLKEALSSKEAFRKQYLYHTELGNCIFLLKLAKLDYYVFNCTSFVKRYTYFIEVK